MYNDVWGCAEILPKVDTTSRSSITKIMPYIEKFGYKFIRFCDILSLLVIEFD